MESRGGIVGRHCRRQKNKMWVTRPIKRTDPIAVTDIVITKLKEGEAFVPWQVWLGDVRSKTVALRANVSWK
jgi:hypothetical protein